MSANPVGQVFSALRASIRTVGELAREKGARFITTNSEIAFILAEGTRVTAELRRALAEK